MMEVVREYTEHFVAHCSTWEEVKEAVDRFRPAENEKYVAELKISFVGHPYDDEEDGFWVVKTKPRGHVETLQADPAFS